MSLFAKRLRENRPIGESWVTALDDYFLGAGAYGVYDEKVLAGGDALRAAVLAHLGRDDPDHADAADAGARPGQRAAGGVADDGADAGGAGRPRAAASGRARAALSTSTTGRSSRGSTAT